MFSRISTLFLVCLMFTIFVSVQKATAAKVDVLPHSFEVRDAKGNLPSDPSTPLFEHHSKKGNPVLAPDGHQVTLAEINAVRGSATAECVKEGTRVTLQLTGLIPNGVYTTWADIYKAPGLLLFGDFANSLGIGASGATDGSDNFFKASAKGEASLSSIIPAGPLSWVGKIGACALDEYEFRIWGAYHIDGKTYGTVPGPEDTWAGIFSALFKNSPTPVQPRGKLATTWGEIKQGQ